MPKDHSHEYFHVKKLQWFSFLLPHIRCFINSSDKIIQGIKGQQDWFQAQICMRNYFREPGVMLKCIFMYPLHLSINKYIFTFIKVWEEDSIWWSIYINITSTLSPSQPKIICMHPFSMFYLLLWDKLGLINRNSWFNGKKL